MNLSKTQQVLAYASSLFPNASITSLMKLSYFIDLVSTKQRGIKITEYEYIGYDYGPFDSNIYHDVNVLIKSGILDSKSAFAGTEEYICYFAGSDIDIDEVVSLDPTEKELIDDVLSKLSGHGARSLSEMAYKTKPMKAIEAEMGGKKHIGKKLNLREGLD